MLFYAQAEVKRLEALTAMPADFGQQNTFEPASEIDDDSDRMRIILQNGNDGLHYAEAHACTPASSTEP